MAILATGETGGITPWTPNLHVHETGSGCRLSLASVASGHGATLQDAADDLINRLLTMVLAIRSAGLRTSAELGPPDVQLLQFLWEIGDLAGRGEDIRDRVFMPRASDYPAN